MNAIVPAATQNIDELVRTAKMLAMSGYFAASGNQDVQIAQLATRILAGAELGFGPFASATDIHIIKGKPVIGANLMASAVKSNPRYDYRVKTLTNTGCTLEYFQDGESIGVSSFTMDDAKAAGLAGKDNWKNYPRNMLFARAMSNGVRLYCPDVFRGNAVYTGDEIEADEWHVVEPDEPSPNGTPPKPAPEPEPVPQQTVEDEAEFVEPEPELSATVTLDKEDIARVQNWLANISTARKSAEDWAVEIGACKNEYEAHNSMTKIVNDHGGKAHTQNIGIILEQYVYHQKEKLAVPKEAA